MDIWYLIIGEDIEIFFTSDELLQVMLQLIQDGVCFTVLQDEFILSAN